MARSNSNFFEGLRISHETIQKLNEFRLFDFGAILILGTADLQGLLHLKNFWKNIHLSGTFQRILDLI